MQLLHVWKIDHADTKTNSEMYGLPNCVMLPLVFDDINHPLQKKPPHLLLSFCIGSTLKNTCKTLKQSTT